ncbi:MAG: signal peptidase I [Pseudomonadota bacterium]
MDVKTKSDTVPDIDNDAADVSPAASDEPKEESLLSFGFFLLKLAVLVLIFRSFVFSPFSIPSESMLPKLWNGDYLLAAKWPYGYSKYSLPFSAPVIPGRVFAGEPEAGDIVIFKHPIDQTDYIKRVIALPGDSIGMVGGQILLNGELVPKQKIEDFVQPVDELMLEAQADLKARGYPAESPCADLAFEEVSEEGVRQCRYPRYRETLPNGISFEVLDFGFEPADNVSATIVPEGRIFVMGDNRDNSQDSRFPAMAGRGVGLVPQENLVGRASIIMWSTDGGSEWIKPWTWFTAARWNRLGDSL